MSTEPWQRAETAGPQRAHAMTKPEVAVAMIKRSKRPIIVAGHNLAENEARPLEYVIQISKAGNMPVVATAHTGKAFLENGYEPASMMGAMDIANRLKDESWTGLDGKGPYDTLLILGLPYFMEWLILSGLKSFARKLTTISLDRYYQPHASWSFPNISEDAWEENLSAIVKGLGGNI
jgi:anaerobic carbon-monoxide dehydrogenase, CODH/ACS complex subunit epsilon